MGGAVSLNSVGLSYLKASDGPQINLLQSGQWEVTVPDGENTRVMALCVDEETAKLLVQAFESLGADK